MEKKELKWEIYEILSEEFVRNVDLHEYMKRSDERFEHLREDSNRRFEAIDRRFDEVDRRFDKMDRDFVDLKDWVGIVVGHFQTRAGRNLEDAIAGTLRITLGRDVKPENITMRKKIIDEDWLIP